MNEADHTHQQTLPPAPEKQPESIVLPERTKKSGGSSPFRRIKGCAATTRQNALSMVVSEERVVAVVALLQNSGREKQPSFRYQAVKEREHSVMISFVRQR